MVYGFTGSKKKKDPSQKEIIWFTRIASGLVQFSFILEETINKYLRSYTEKYPAEVDETRNDLHVDNLITGGETFEQVASLKGLVAELVHEIIKLFLQKNQLSVKLNEIKSWKKDKVVLAVEITSEIKNLTTKFHKNWHPYTTSFVLLHKPP